MEEKKNNNNKLVIILMGVIILILGVLCYLFATGKISLDTNKEDSEENNIIDNNNENDNKISSKLVDNLNNGNSETTFNGITVIIKQNLSDMVCVASEINVNGENIKSNINELCIDSYEIYDSNVIFLASSTSNKTLYIYDNISKKIVFDGTNNNLLKDYKIKSYYSNDDKIIIDAIGCGAQCGLSNDYEKGTFVLTYSNGVFSELNK